MGKRHLKLVQRYRFGRPEDELEDTFWKLREDPDLCRRAIKELQQDLHDEVYSNAAEWLGGISASDWLGYPEHLSMQVAE